MTTKNVRAQQTETDEIDDLRARLTTAGDEWRTRWERAENRLNSVQAECDIAVGNLRMAEGEVRDAMSELEVETTRRRAAEARVEAAREVFERMSEHPVIAADDPAYKNSDACDWHCTSILVAEAKDALAALACPPQDIHG